MAYNSVNERLTGMLYKAHSCPYLFGGTRCAGGDYCPFPEGDEVLCCFFCSHLDACPDPTGICKRLE